MGGMKDDPEQTAFNTDDLDTAFANFFDAFARALGVYWLADKLLAVLNWWEESENDTP
jgi:hypothetical protein